MAVTTTIAAVPSARPFRSAAAVFAGFLAVAVLSLGTDQILHVLQIYPPWGAPMWDPKLNLLALTYRIVYGVGGGYLTASLAPHRPMRHVVVLGILGTIAGAAGVIATWNLGFGPRWYPVAVAVTGFPCCWLGCILQRSHPRRAS